MNETKKVEVGINFITVKRIIYCNAIDLIKALEASNSPCAKGIKSMYLKYLKHLMEQVIS